MFHGTKCGQTEPPDGRGRGPVGELAALVAGLAGSCSVEPLFLGDGVLCDAMVTVERARRFLDAVEAELLVEAVQRGVTDLAFGLRTGAWLAREAKLPSGMARKRVAVAKKLSRFLPHVDKALREGRIGYEHARVFADAANPRILEQFSAATPALIDEIDTVSFEVWKRDVEAIAGLLDQHGGHNPSDDIERNRLSVKTVGDVTVIHGELVGEQAVIANRVLNALADELFDKFRRDNEITPELEIPKRETLLALALVEACRRGLNTGGRAPRPEAQLTLTPNDLNHHCGCCNGGHSDGDDGEDGVSEGAGDGEGSDGDIHGGEADGGHGAEGHGDGSLGPPGVYRPPGSGGPPGEPAVGGFRVSDLKGVRFGTGWGIGHPTRELIDQVAEQLASNMDTWHGMWVTNPNGEALPRRAFKTLLCDTDIRTLVINSLGVPLDMGSKIRFANHAQRRALASRDGGCVFPGCDAPPEWTDAHHTIQWALSHTTDVNRLLSLCRHHHGVAHRKNWKVDLRKDGYSQWTTPNRHTFTGQRHSRTPTPEVTSGGGRDRSWSLAG